ncbi:MAG: ArsR/SmtB family transcription factor [Solirubrobacteraceae bacterium]
MTFSGSLWDAGTSCGPSARLLVLASQRLQILAEPTRIALILQLERDSATVQELADRLSLPHGSASKHLNVLYHAGVVSRCRQGSYMAYALADYTVPQVIRQAIAGLAGHVDELAEITAGALG